MNNLKIEPHVIWLQIADYLTAKGNHVKKLYANKMLGKEQNEWKDVFTWEEVDNLVKQLHEQIDSLSNWER